jgi:hypothetical protein
VIQAHEIPQSEWKDFSSSSSSEQYDEQPHSTTEDREVLDIQPAEGTTTLVRHGSQAEQPRKVERFPRKGDDEDIPE